MTDGSGAAGLAALSVCESLLLSLTDNNIIDEVEAKGILADAAAAHRGVVPQADGSAGNHAEAAALLEEMIRHGNSVRRVRPNCGNHQQRSRRHGHRLIRPRAVRRMPAVFRQGSAGTRPGGRSPAAPRRAGRRARCPWRRPASR